VRGARGSPWGSFHIYSYLEDMRGGRGNVLGFPVPAADEKRDPSPPEEGYKRGTRKWRGFPRPRCG
jgi:hypothetical protein